MTPHILTHTGVMFNLFDPSPEDIRLADIGHALARITRYTGHGDGVFTDAQHCVLTEALADLAGEPRAVRAWALLHDSPEAYVNDASSPLKEAMRQLARADRRMGSDYDAIYHRVEESVLVRFGVPKWDVAAYDKGAALLEVECNGPHSCEAHTWPEYRGPRPRLPEGVWPAELAEFMWLQRAGELGLN